MGALSATAKPHAEAVCPDLAKFHHFDNFWTSYFLFGKILSLLWQSGHFGANFYCCKRPNIEK